MDGITIEMGDVKYPNIEVPLEGGDGNAAIIIARVARAIRYQYGDEAAQEFRDEAKASKSYDDLLQFVMRTVETS